MRETEREVERRLLFLCHSWPPSGAFRPLKSPPLFRRPLTLHHPIIPPSLAYPPPSSLNPARPALLSTFPASPSRSSLLSVASVPPTLRSSLAFLPPPPAFSPPPTPTVLFINRLTVRSGRGAIWSLRSVFFFFFVCVYVWQADSETLIHILSDWVTVSCHVAFQARSCSVARTHTHTHTHTHKQLPFKLLEVWRYFFFLSLSLFFVKNIWVSQPLKKRLWRSHSISRGFKNAHFSKWHFMDGWTAAPVLSSPLHHFSAHCCDYRPLCPHHLNDFSASLL